MADNDSGGMNAIVAVVAIVAILAVAYFAVQIFGKGNPAQPSTGIDVHLGGSAPSNGGY